MLVMVDGVGITSLVRSLVVLFLELITYTRKQLITSKRKITKARKRGERSLVASKRLNVSLFKGFFIFEFIFTGLKTWTHDNSLQSLPLIKNKKMWKSPTKKKGFIRSARK